MSDPLVGTRLGNCVLKRKIGAGGMSMVYLAHHEGLDRPVAIKILSRDLIGSEANVQRFLREARTAAALEHPNIVTIHDVGESGDVHYIAMQFVEGRSLEAVIGLQGALSLSRAVAILKQVCAALAAAHRLGIVHRDVKPANILVTEQDVVKVVDFGLARVVDGKTATAEGPICGTPYYMAPEQATGGRVDGRTDIYSLGATFYRLVTGTHCFSGDTTISIIKKQIEAQPRPPHEIVSGLPPALSTMIARMMAKKPADRYATAEEVSRALDLLPSDPFAPTVAVDQSLEALPSGGETLLDLGAPVTGSVARATATRPATAPSVAREAEDQALVALAMEKRIITQSQLDDSIVEALRLQGTGQFVTPVDILLRRKELQPLQVLQLRAERLASSRAASPAGSPAITASTPAAIPALSAPNASADPTDILQGSIIGRYKLIRIVTTGESATYWEAQAGTEGRPVGLLVARTNDAGLSKRVYGEVARAKTLVHAHILRMYEAGVETDRKGRLVNYLVTDFIEARSFHGVLADKPTPRRLAEWFETLAQTLHHAHGGQILHGSLTKGSVFISAKDQPMLLFCSLGEAGARFYTPPEHVEHTRSEPTPQTDVYRLGVLMYDALMGRPPFVGNPGVLERKIASERPPAVHLNPAVESPLGDVVMRALEKDPHLRFQTAADMALALRKFLAPEPPKPPAAPPPARRRRHPKRMVAWLALGAIALTGAMVTYDALRRYERRQRQRDEERAFAALVEEATRLHAQGEYGRAMALCDDASKRQRSPEVDALRLSCRIALIESALVEGTAALREAEFAQELPPSDLARRLEASVRESERLPSPRPWRLLALEGSALHTLNRADEADRRLREAAAADSGSAVRLALARVLMERWMTGLVLDRVLRGDCELRRRSMSWLREGVTGLPRSAEAFAGVDAGIAGALQLLAEGDSDAVTRFCDEEMVRLGVRQPYEELLVIAACASRDPQRKLRYLATATARRPQYGFARFMMGAIRLAEFGPDQAQGDVIAAANLMPTSGPAHLLAAITYFRTGDVLRATQHLDAAIASSANFVDALNLRSRARMTTGNRKGALADCDLAVALQPDHAATLLNRARIRLLAGEPDGALNDVSRILARHAQDATATAIRGLAKLARADVEGALTDFESAIRLDAQEPAGWAGRAMLRARQGDFRAAVADGERALNLAPPDWPERPSLLKTVEEARSRSK